MKIRNRITIRFIVIFAVLFFISLLLIYLLSSSYRKEDFYSRLQSKANNTAKLLIEVDEINAALLRRIEMDNPVSLPNEKIIIFDFRNDILFSTDDGEVISVSSTLLDRIRLEEELRFTQGEYEILGFLFKGPYDRFVVVIGATDIYGLNKLRNLRTVLVVVFLISIVGVSVSGWFFSGKALQPISQVVKQVDDISITSLNLRVDEGNGKDEIAHLAGTFNRMLDRLETSFNTQKDFISNASHELRTPLTAIIGQLEVTMLNRRSNDEYERVMESVLEDMKNLNSLSNGLLLLAQTGIDRTERKMMPLRIDDLVWQTREELIERHPDYRIRIDLDDKLDDELSLTVEGDEQLIRVALSNIIKNGCKYGQDGPLDILIKPSRRGLTLCFSDQGIGIPPKDLPNVFEPFYRAANTQNIKGHGIGLSMVKRIINLHHGTIRITSKLGEGTIVTVDLPAVKRSHT